MLNNPFITVDRKVNNRQNNNFDLRGGSGLYDTNLDVNKEDQERKKKSLLYEPAPPFFISTALTRQSSRKFSYLRSKSKAIFISEATRFENWGTLLRMYILSQL